MIDSTRERVRDASDTVAVIGETVDLRPTGKELRGLCPFHDDHNPSLCVNPDKQRWYCHPCGKSGDVFSWIMARDGTGFPDALRTLAERAGIAIEHAPRRSMLGGVTVAQLAAAKNLDPAVLKALGVTDAIHKGQRAVRFPSADPVARTGCSRTSNG